MGTTGDITLRCVDSESRPGLTASAYSASLQTYPEIVIVNLPIVADAPVYKRFFSPISGYATAELMPVRARCCETGTR